MYYSAESVLYVSSVQTEYLNFFSVTFYKVFFVPLNVQSTRHNFKRRYCRIQKPLILATPLADKGTAAARA